MKKVEIEYVLVRTPKCIVVDGKEYPNTQRNHDIVAEYNKTLDDTVLDKLSDIVLVF